MAVATEEKARMEARADAQVNTLVTAAQAKAEAETIVAAAETQRAQAMHQMMKDQLAAERDERARLVTQTEQLAAERDRKAEELSAERERLAQDQLAAERTRVAKETAAQIAAAEQLAAAERTLPSTTDRARLSFVRSFVC